MVVFTTNRSVSIRGALTTFNYTPIIVQQGGRGEEEEALVPDEVVAVLDEFRSVLRADILSELVRLRNIKWHIACRVRFLKIVLDADSGNETEVSSVGVFHGSCQVSLTDDDLDEHIDASYIKILESIARYTREGSGWTIDEVLKVELVVARYLPLAASSYIRTPPKIQATKAVVNVNNPSDEKCFLWSVLAHLYPQPTHAHRDRVSKYRPFASVLNMTGIEYPVSVAAISKFENLNTNISINVFGCDDGKEIFPLKITKCQGRTHHINLLLISDNQGRKHFILITSMSRLLSSLTNHQHAVFYCNYCLHRFSEQRLLTAHIPNCTPHGEQKTTMPKQEESVMYFKNYTYCLKVPFTIYADFESLIVPVQSCSTGIAPATVQSSGVLHSVPDNGLPRQVIDPPVSSTSHEAMHVPSGFCYAILDHERKLVKPPTLYRGDNVIDTFLAELTQDTDMLMQIIRCAVPMNMTDADNDTFTNATHCHLCQRALTAGDKVRNHCHRTGTFLGAAHNVCNLNYKMVDHIPVFFHNLRGYDCHHLIQGLGKYDDKNLKCIATTSERYVSLSLGHIRFVDSLQFLNQSLETLVDNLFKGGSGFPVLRQRFTEHVDLLVRKGVYPYEYADSFAKFDETSLPAREHFVNRLAESTISDADYVHAQSVWSAFNMRTFGDYHDLYLLTDVLLLADVFESFRDTALCDYQLDPCHFYSLPGFAWNAMLKMTGVRLDLLTDIDQHLFVESGIRGGVAMVSNRYARANNPLIPDQYNAVSPPSYILYTDCNNLYGAAMSCPLPYADFRWLDRNEIESLDVRNVSDDSDTGYILEVDLHYPVRLHDRHSDYPLAPERKRVNPTTLSPFSKQLSERLFKSAGASSSSVEKLLTTLDDKKNYVLHIKNLKLYLSLGLELKAVHRVLSFKQCAWLKPFIDFNTRKRQTAANNFEKDLYKLMNNAVYGKSLENVRKRIDFQLVSNERRLLKLVSTPRLKRMIRYTDDLVGLSMRRRSTVLSRPVYVGFTVLDVSKTIMYDFHYRYAVAKYGARIKLLMTDTDSLLYSVQTRDLYADMRQDLHLFDTSDYPVDHPCYSVANKKIVGKFKDETCGHPIREFVGLRAKCYSFLLADGQAKRVAKGVPRVSIKRRLRHDLYRECLQNHSVFATSAVVIRSERHRLYSMRAYKQSLSAYDDKRYILDNGQDTLAYGHYGIPHNNEHNNDDDDDNADDPDNNIHPLTKRARHE